MNIHIPKLERAAELLIAALQNVNKAKENLQNIENMQFYAIYNKWQEKKEDIQRAKDQINSAQESLKRQVKYTLIELNEL